MTITYDWNADLAEVFKRLKDISSGLEEHVEAEGDNGSRGEPCPESSKQ